MSPQETPQPKAGVEQHRRVISPTALAEQGQALLQSRLWVPHTHNDGAVSRATVQFVPAMTPGHKAGSPRDSAMCRVPPSPCPDTVGEQELQPRWAKAVHTHPRAGSAPEGGQAALGAGSQAPPWSPERETRDTHSLSVFPEQRGKMCLSCLIWHMHDRGTVRACSGAPGLSPPSPGTGAPPHSPLDAESQDNSIVTLQGLLALVRGTGIPHLTENTRQRLEPGQDVSTQRRKQAACHLGTACHLPLPASPQAWRLGQQRE